MNERAFAELREDTNAARGAGVTHILAERVSVPPGDDPFALVDSWVTRLGFKPLSTSWVEVPVSEAAGILRSILHRDLAYRVEIMPTPVAQELADRFCALFPSTARYFTNGACQLGQSGEYEQPCSWAPLTDATFDAGIVAVDEGWMGMVWVEDED